MTRPAPAPSLIVIVPGQVPHRLSPNRNRGYGRSGYVTKLKDGMRHDWFYAIRAACPAGTPAQFTDPVSCQITYYRAKGEKLWDGDNLLGTLKVGLDQLQATGVVVNDNLIRYEPVIQERDPDGWGYVLIELRALSGARAEE